LTQIPQLVLLTLTILMVMALWIYLSDLMTQKLINLKLRRNRGCGFGLLECWNCGLLLNVKRQMSNFKFIPDALWGRDLRYRYDIYDLLF